MARPKSARLIHSSDARSELTIVLTEGRKREIRRMMARLGFDVSALVRTVLGPLELGNLRPGEWRMLNGEEVGELRGALGLGPSQEARDEHDAGE